MQPVLQYQWRGEDVEKNAKWKLRCGKAGKAKLP